MPDSLAALFEWRLALAAAIIALAGVVRGFSGFGSALILSPSMAAIYGPEAGIPLVMLLEVFVSCQLLPRAWRIAQRREVGLMTLACVATIPLGAWILEAADPQALRLAISIGILLFLGVLLLGIRRRRETHRLGLAAAGAASGLTNGASGIGGPPVVLYYLAGRQTAATIRANVITYFFMLDAITIVYFAGLGLITLGTMLVAVITLPASMLGTLIGSRLFSAASERLFRLVAFAIIGTVAVVSALA